MEHWIRDIRLAARALLKKPGFAVIAILTLSLGIGANTAIFTVVYSVLLQPLDLDRPDQLVRVWESHEGDGKPFESPSPANFIDFRERNQVFEEMTYWANSSLTLQMDDGRPEELDSIRVSPNFFTMLGIQPDLGRAFANTEGREPVAILGHGLWQRRFGGQASIVGQPILLDGTPYEIIGIMPADLGMPRADIEIFVPQEFETDQFRFRRYLGVIARLKNNVSIEQADADLDRIGVQLEEAYPRSNTGYRATLVPLKDDVIGDAKQRLLFLFGSVGLVLLIACANVAALLLARATRREPEIAVRGALGAGRLELIRPLLAESLVLGISAGVLGLLLAHWGLQALLALEPGDLPRIQEVSIDGFVLLFSLVLSILTACIFGLFPAIKASRPNLQLCLKEGGGRGNSDGQDQHMGLRFLTVAEIALALVLLIGAGLLIRSFISLRGVDPGFSTENILVGRISLDGQRYPDPETRATYFETLISELESLPGVEQAAAVSTLPLAVAGIDFDIPYRGEGQPRLDSTELPEADFRIATDGYFETLRIQVLSGRSFNAFDRADNQPVVVINQALAQQIWAGEEAVGKRLDVYFGQPTEYLVIGVVQNTLHQGYDAKARPQMFIPQAQLPRFTFMTVAIQMASAEAVSRELIQDVFLRIDPLEPVSKLTTMEVLASDSLSRERFLALLLTLMAGLAVTLAAVGIYGLMAYSVTERTQEIGIRIALGAEGSSILALIVGQGALLASTGVAIGLFAAWLFSGLLQSFLFGIGTRDPSTFAGVALLLLSVGIVACSVPAFRASRIDPIRALRQS